ncbi:hypothetical protein BJX66DRAFT_334494 [Aspergillus keveii]|uniref:Uncharacterized protein n=1 Tax=Aspergillus keveii TaxID=714993 RepID=A0ABR4GGH3_9EURO
MGHASDEDNPTHHYATALQSICVRAASLPSEVIVLCELAKNNLLALQTGSQWDFDMGKKTYLPFFLSTVILLCFFFFSLSPGNLGRPSWLKKNLPMLQVGVSGELDCVD